MRKTIASLAAFLFASTLFLTAKAQSSEPSSSTLVGEIIAVVAVVIVLAFIAYAGYKVVKKWSRQSD